MYGPTEFLPLPTCFFHLLQIDMSLLTLFSQHLDRENGMNIWSKLFYLFFYLCFVQYRPLCLLIVTSSDFFGEIFLSCSTFTSLNYASIRCVHLFVLSRFQYVVVVCFLLLLRWANQEYLYWAKRTRAFKSCARKNWKTPGLDGMRKKRCKRKQNT